MSEKHENAHTRGELQQLQSLSLEQKILLTKERIRVWYESWHRFDIVNSKTGATRFEVRDMRDPDNLPTLKEDEYIDSEIDGWVRVSFSGGKDSTVLLHMVRSMFPDVEAVYVDTGLEYPEIRQFAMSFPNVTMIRPSMRFDEVIKKYGYPIISKEVAECVFEGRKNLRDGGNKYTYRLKELRGESFDKQGRPSMFNKKKYEPLLYTDFVIGSYCCKHMKKNPFHQHEKITGKKPMTGTTAEESRLREEKWIEYGCNMFGATNPVSNPMAFWTEQDVLAYIKKYNLPIASVYGEIVPSGGGYTLLDSCPECAECIKYETTGAKRTGCIYCGFGLHLEKGETRFQRLKKTHPKQYAWCIGGGEYNEQGMWQPNKQGLGLGHVFDELNKLYGENFIRYK